MEKSEEEEKKWAMRRMGGVKALLYHTLMLV